MQSQAFKRALSSKHLPFKHRAAIIPHSTVDTREPPVPSPQQGVLPPRSSCKSDTCKEVKRKGQRKERKEKRKPENNHYLICSFKRTHSYHLLTLYVPTINSALFNSSLSSHPHNTNPQPPTSPTPLHPASTARRERTKRTTTGSRPPSRASGMPDALRAHPRTP